MKISMLSSVAHNVVDPIQTDTMLSSYWSSFLGQKCCELSQVDLQLQHWYYSHSVFPFKRTYGQMVEIMTIRPSQKLPYFQYSITKNILTMHFVKKILCSPSESLISPCLHGLWHFPGLRNIGKPRLLGFWLNQLQNPLLRAASEGKIKKCM